MMTEHPVSFALLDVDTPTSADAGGSLDAVYRPELDGHVLSSIEALEPLPLADLARLPETSVPPLIDLEPHAIVRVDTAPPSLLASVPSQYKVSIEEPSLTIDLSAHAAPAAEGQPHFENVLASGATAPVVGSSGIRTEGFGSNELFQSPREKEEASAILTQLFEKLPENLRDKLPETIVDRLPENVLERLPEPVRVRLAAASSKNSPGAASTAVPGTNAGFAAGGAPAVANVPVVNVPGGVVNDPARLSTHHIEIASNRATDGRWVPTYMRQQLAEEGRVPLPTLQRDPTAPPVSIATTLGDMGQELNEEAQGLLTYVFSLIAKINLQCQLCTRSTVSTLHEHTVGEEDEYAPLLKDLVPEAEAGLGPMRSRVTRSMKEGNNSVTFKNLLEIVSTRLVTGETGQEPSAAFRQSVKSRRFVRRQVHSDMSTESWAFVTELTPDILPVAMLQHLCVGAPIFREQWHVNPHEGTASAELSRGAAGGLVNVVLRLDVTQVTAMGACDVDSRLYAQCKDTSTPMPIGLVEQLIEGHHRHSERLRDIILELASIPPQAPSWHGTYDVTPAAAPSSPSAAPSSTAMVSLPSIAPSSPMGVPASSSGVTDFGVAPNMLAAAHVAVPLRPAQGSCSAEGTAELAASNSSVGTIDKSMLYQVAVGI